AGRRYSVPTDDLALRGARDVRLRDGTSVACVTVLEALARTASAYDPDTAERITWVPADLIRETALVLAAKRPVSHYYFNGLVQHTNATQTCRALAVLYALLGDLDAPGGNVMGSGVQVANVADRAALGERAESVRL